ncbi:hypothetical protein V2J09_006313, partial [Rumex salicifolius]
FCLAFLPLLCLPLCLCFKSPAPKTEIILPHLTYMTGTPGPDSESFPGSGQMNVFRVGSSIQAMAISDPMMNGTNGRSDTFIVDLENFSYGGLEKDVISNSRVNMQRSFSRKGTVQGGDQEPLLVSSSSPRAAGCNSTPEKVAAAYSHPPVVVVAVEPKDPSGFTATSVAPQSRWGRRYNSFKRSPPPYWFSDPKRVLLFFAAL